MMTTDQQGFQPDRCTCGHLSGDHRNVPVPLGIVPGICLVKGCGCRKCDSFRTFQASPTGQRVAETVKELGDE